MKKIYKPKLLSTAELAVALCVVDLLACARDYADNDIPRNADKVKFAALNYAQAVELLLLQMRAP